MKSVSGNDGSYSLKVSFELGTDPDINTVNVNNRVQVALAKLPDDVKRQGVTVKKQSSALLGVISLYSPKQTLDELFISNYATINLLDQIKSSPGVGDVTLFGPQDYSMRAWVRTDRLTGLGLTTADVINAIKSQNVQAAVGRLGARPTSQRSAVAAQYPDQGPSRVRSGFREDHHQDKSRWFRSATWRHCQVGAGGCQSRSLDQTERCAGHAYRDLPGTGRQCAFRTGWCQADHGRRGIRNFQTTWPGRSPMTRRHSSRLPFMR